MQIYWSWKEDFISIIAEYKDLGQDQKRGQKLAHGQEFKTQNLYYTYNFIYIKSSSIPDSQQ